MSYSLPRNVPRFDDEQRAYENTYWAARRPQQNRHASNGSIGLEASFDGHFDHNSLPMYKDKPYDYGRSGRYVPLVRRKRFWLASALAILFFIFVWTILLPYFHPHREDGRSKILWKWMKGSSEPDWNLRREAVKEAFKISWDAYSDNAWGKDIYWPLSKSGKQMTPTGMGWIIVDALDTLILMNLTSRLSHARQWMTTSLNYNQDASVNTFETTIRMLGGLLSAQYLSTEYPHLAPLEDDDPGKPGEDLYLEKAADLADRLLGAFDTDSGIPYASVNLKSLKGIPNHLDSGASSTAEAGSLQLEFKYLAMLMGEKIYWQKVEKVNQVIDENGMQDGLVPIFIHPDSGKFKGRTIRLGSRGDSYYEYLIKQYLQTSKEEPVYKELWDEALAGVQKHLIAYTKQSSFTILGERPEGLGRKFSPKMDHLVCFMPGTIALGATEGLPLEEARKLDSWTPKREEEIVLAKELMKTCWGMYKATLTGLAPEITYFDVDNPPRRPTNGLVASEPVDFFAVRREAAKWKKDYIIKYLDTHNLQRPETVESLFYLWRITGDVMYREWGWEMFKSFVEWEAVDDGGGFTSLSKANQIPPIQKDNMESFWLAETLKYLYLLFSPNDLLPLDTIVINTEAHIFPRFKLQRGLKTGWTRKPKKQMTEEEQPKESETAGTKTVNEDGEKAEKGKPIVQKAVKKSADGDMRDPA